MKSGLRLTLWIMFGVLTANAQSVELNGKVSGPDEVDGIHIINKTASRFTISNADGTFIIPAKLNDTILFSGISYQPKEIVVTKFIMSSKQMPVYLEELVNALDEVVVGKILTGDLMSDIINAELKSKLDFYNLGIPGYTGKLKTQTERRLHQATSGVGFIVNSITGRIKQLKEHVKLEKADDCLDRMKSNFSDDLFSNYDLEDGQKVAFFYYCQDDPAFETLCKTNNDMAIFEFLQTKFEVYKVILQTQND